MDATASGITPVSSSPWGACVWGVLPHYTFKLFLLNHFSEGEHWPKVTKEVVVVAGRQEEGETQVCSQTGGRAEVKPSPHPQQRHGSRAR